MNTVIQIVAGASLLLLVVMPVGYLAGHFDLPQVLRLLTVATIGWFAAAILQLRPRDPRDDTRSGPTP